MKCYFFFKRLFDIVTSTIALVILSPLFLVIAIAIKLDSKGPVIFKQERMGYQGKPYNMYKFRSMVQDAQSMGSGLYSFKDDPRVTKVGKVLRHTSLDELPQLANVLKGDMAYVGPRSPVVSGFPKYEDLSDTYKRRFSVLPGITGLAQVVGRNEFSWDEKVEYDNIYIDKIKKWGLLYDIKILFMTVVRVGSMSDVEESPENMEKNKDLMNMGHEQLDSSQNKVNVD